MTTHIPGYCKQLLLLCTICMPLLTFAQKKINVKDYGAVGDGKTDDTHAFEVAFKAAVLQNAVIIFEKNRIYVVDTLSLVGKSAAPIKKMVINGNGATLKSITKSNGNILTCFYVDTLNITNLKIIGNKSFQKNGNGIGIYYAKNCTISNCTISNCKLSGILIAWVKYALIENNKVYNNGDGTLPTDGIGIHSLQEGIIRGNIVYNNNPLSNQDGDGIQIGAATSGIVGYYDINNLQKILIEKNIAYGNGRRGIKIQRSNVDVFRNFLSDNAIGVSLVRGDFSINTIQVKANVVQKSYIGINTDGGGKAKISHVTISNNYLLGSIMTDKIQLKDAANLDVANNSFIRKQAEKYGKDNRYFDINAVSADNIDLDQANIPDLKLNNNRLFKNRVGSAAKKAAISQLILITQPGTVSVPESNGFNNDYFMVYSNETSGSVTVSIKGVRTKNIVIKKGHQLILYSCNKSIYSYLY